MRPALISTWSIDPGHRIHRVVREHRPGRECECGVPAGVAAAVLQADAEPDVVAPQLRRRPVDALGADATLDVDVEAMQIVRLPPRRQRAAIQAQPQVDAKPLLEAIAGRQR